MSGAVVELEAQADLSSTVVCHMQMADEARGPDIQDGS